VQIPAEMRRRPPERTLAWVAGLVGAGARVTRVRRLRNAWAAVMHAVDVEDRTGARHPLVLRRWARVDLTPDIGIVENEVATLGVIGDTALPVPRLVGADPRGEHADAPTVVMTRVPGRSTLAPADLDGYLAGLAGVLREIHAVPVAPGILNYFRPWSLDTVVQPPSWTTQPAVWTRAIEIANRPVPVHERVLLHRDYWPGNVLWSRGQVSGVVDWSHSCRGPAAADVAHCRLNLALLFGLDAADRFTTRYGEVADLAWHDVADAVSVGGEHPPAVWRWHDAGRTDLTQDGILATIDAFLARAVSRVD
jgi:aminoglycoside phosphotransferase (APT) family kinase protein